MIPVLFACLLAADEPFAFADFTWMNGQSRQNGSILKLADAVTFSLYLDAYYAFSTNRPIDDTLTGSATVGRHNEVQISLASVGAEWNYKHFVGRLSLQVGATLSIVQDLDGTAARGRNNSTQNLRYIREATLGYHFDVLSGLKLEAGIFMSFIGLESYLVAENWNYTRSMVSDLTPFYFQGVRAQFFPTAKIKIEPWLMNGWQSYGKWNFAPSGGLALRLSPSESFTFFANFYVGSDTKATPGRVRFHHDDSFIVRYYQGAGLLSKLAFSMNTHIGFEDGAGQNPGYFIGGALAHRAWFFDDFVALTLRLEAFSNPTRYLLQYPPPGFQSGPGTDLKAYGFTATIDLLPSDLFTLRLEGQYRAASDGYFAGHGGTTSPDGFADATQTGFVSDTAKQQGLFILSANFRL